MALSRTQVSTYRSRRSQTPPTSLPHSSWNYLEDDLLAASVLDMDDTSSCVEGDLDPSSHHDSGGEDKSQPDSTHTPRYPPLEINNLGPTPSVIPDTDHHMSDVNELATDQFPGCDIETNVSPAIPVHQDVIPLSSTQRPPCTGTSLPWVNTMIDFLSQFNQLKDDHRSLQETAKRFDDSFVKLTSKVQTFTADLLVHQFGSSGSHNGADSQMCPPSDTGENALDTQGGPIAQHRTTDIDQSEIEYGQPAVEERSGGALLDHVSQGGSVVESSSRLHPPIFLRIKRPTVTRVNISPPRCRSKRVKNAKDAVYVSRKASVIFKILSADLKLCLQRAQ